MPQRQLALSALLAVIVVLAAGIVGPAHFGGLRWLPTLHSSHHPPRNLHQLQTHGRQPTNHLPPVSHGGGSIPLVPTLIVIGVVIAILILWYLRRHWRIWRVSPPSKPTVAAAARPVEPEPEPEPDVPALLSGIEKALRLLDEQREPADAIVRAWLGLQETAAESGIVRGAAETPTEFTSRILNRAFADDRAVRTLLRLYLRTRFGDHPATEDDVAAAREALRALAESWPVADSDVTAGIAAR